jgi:hypothetical protein
MELLISILGGGATGLLGTMFDRMFIFFEKKEERKFIIEKYQLDSQERAKERESEVAIAENSVASQMMIESYNHDSNIGVADRWVINILRLIRPVITLFLWFLVALIWLTVEEQYNFKGQIISTVLYCATAATLWWFGSRDKHKSK